MTYSLPRPDTYLCTLATSPRCTANRYFFSSSERDLAVFRSFAILFMSVSGGLVPLLRRGTSVHDAVRSREPIVRYREGAFAAAESTVRTRTDAVRILTASLGSQSSTDGRTNFRERNERSGITGFYKVGTACSVVFRAFANERRR